MAAFSFQHPQPFLLDTVFFPNTPTKISEITVEGNINGFTCFSQPHSLQEIPADFRIHESSCLDHSSRVVLVDDEPSVTRKLSTDSSSMVDNKLENDEQVTQKVSPVEKKRKNGEGSSSTTTTSTAQSKDLREGKCKKKRNCFNEKNDEEQNQSKAEKKERRTVTEEAPKGYIHVRARRGQATDNHSLAERVRREKISERMKILQSLVPGCDKVTGKALMLDEIINYVQSLQNQVEFLSMKLASLNPMFYDFGMDLDALMARPETVNTLVPALPPMQQCSPALPTTFIDSANIILPPSNNYSLLDHSTALLLQEVEEQRLNGIPQDNGDLVWHLDEQRQQYINQDGFNSLH